VPERLIFLAAFGARSGDVRTNHGTVEHLDQTGGFAGLGQKLEERLEDAGLAEAPEPLSDAVPGPERRRRCAPGQIIDGEKCGASRNLRSFRPGWPRRDWAAAKTCNVIAQSSSVIPVSIAGVPCCRFAMNRRIADSGTPILDFREFVHTA
jgi:hypothetical protein